MSEKHKAPTLTEAGGMGGVIAQEGFDYQLWDGLARLPYWLSNPTFEGMIFEGLEDLEARFFAPQAPHGRLLERYQAKSGALAPKDVGEVFESFRRFDATYPRHARTHTLVTPQLPATLSWMGRDAERVRKARPFYAPFADVLAASEGKLRDDFVAQFEGPLGPFVADAVEVSERVLPDRDSALHAFSVALHRAFPEVDAGTRKIENAFDAVSNLARRSIGEFLDRQSLTEQLEIHLGSALASRGAFPLHLRSDRQEVKERALEIDASAFSGGERPFPATEAWSADLLVPLERTARWLKGRGAGRVILSGSYRLTTGLSLGWSFRSALGFELEIPTRDAAWATDDRPQVDETFPNWDITDAEALHDKRLVVSVGIIRNPSADLVRGGIQASSILTALLPGPVTSGRAAQVGVSAVKHAVAASVTRLRPERLDLFFAGPAPFAVALGHRWNAMPPTQLHEFVSATGKYVPTALLK